MFIFSVAVYTKFSAQSGSFRQFLNGVGVDGHMGSEGYPLFLRLSSFFFAFLFSSFFLLFLRFSLFFVFLHFSPMLLGQEQTTAIYWEGI